MKCLHTNDWHLWHLTPSSRLDIWPDTLFRKLDQVAEIARDVEQVDVIAVAGDLFHSINTSFTVVTRFLNWARNLGIPIVAIPGNHDERYNRVDSTPSTPIGALFASGQVIDVSYEVYRVSGVQIVGVPWPHSKYLSNWEYAARQIDPTKPSIALGHAFASDTGGQFFGQPAMSYQALAALPFGVCHFGHDHSAQGSRKIGHKLFLNFGALGRGSLAGEELERVIYVAVTEIQPGWEGFKGRLVRLKFEPAAAVFDLQRYAFEKEVAAQFQEGLGQQIAEDFLSMVTESLADRVAALEVDDDVRARVQQYLTAAEEAVA